jgi:hypothetical protein
MSNKFNRRVGLSGSAIDIGRIASGSLSIYGSTLSGANLTPDFPLTVDANKKIYSTANLKVVDLETADTVSINADLQKIVNFTASVDKDTNITGQLIIGDLTTDDINSLNDELDKIRLFEPSSGSDTNISGRLRVGEISTNRIYDNSITNFIELDGTTVEVSANDLTVNGFPVIKTSDTAGTLPVGDLQTSTVGSLNTELQKINNFEPSTSTDTNISGRLRVGEISTARIGDISNTSFINITNSDISIGGRVSGNGGVLLSATGGNAINGTFIVNQTVFTEDQQLITKKYVDDNSGGGGGGTIQNGNLGIQPTNQGSVVGNSRGANSVDLQTIRSSAVQVAQGIASGILYGRNNEARATGSCCGGDGNVVSNDYSAVFGQNNFCSGPFTFMTGYGHNMNSSNSLVGGDSSTIFTQNSLVCGRAQTGDTSFSVIGGNANSVRGNYSNVVGENITISSANHCSAFGKNHTISGCFNSTAVGDGNILNGLAGNSFCAGASNVINAPHCIVSGKNNNINSTGGNAACFGDSNFISGFSGVAMGQSNTVTGSNSVALGYGAEAVNGGTFVFCDGSSEDSFASTDNNTFNIRATGGLNLASVSDSKLNFNINGVSKGSISCPVNGTDSLVIASAGQDIRLFSKFGKINTNCQVKLGSFDYDYPNVNFRSGSTLSDGSSSNSTYGTAFTPKVGITINTLLIPSNLFNDTQGADRDVSIWENGNTTPVFNTTFTRRTTAASVRGFYTTDLAVPFVCQGGIEYIIGCRVQFGDNIDNSTTSTTAVIVGSNTGLDDLFSNVRGLYNILPRTNGTRFPTTSTTGITPFILFNFSTNTTGKEIECSNVICDTITVGNPPVETESKIISHIDYSNLYPFLMIADIDGNVGGVNKCWGNTATYIAAVQLRAGRVVSLADAPVGNDNSVKLLVEYLRVNTDENQPTIYPIGITQHNANAGEPITVCILGYTTAILQSGDGSPERGSIVLSDSSQTGKIRTDITASNNQARIGFVAQSNNGFGEDAMLIYYSGYFQPY